MTTVFVAGIHGVGKTTCCATAAQVLAFRHITASEVIKEAKSSAISESGKVVADLDENQRLLIAGMTKLRGSYQRILLDGHLTLVTEIGIRRIPVEVFRALTIDGLVVVLDEPHEIQRRCQERDKSAPHVDAIRTHQADELSHAEEVAQGLNVPLERIYGSETASLVAAICRVTNQ